MATPKEYIRLKREVEGAEKAASRAEGALEEVMKRIKDEFGCTSLDSAKKKLAQLSSKESKCKEDFEAAVEEYREKWEDNETN